MEPAVTRALEPRVGPVVAQELEVVLRRGGLCDDVEPPRFRVVMPRLGEDD